MSELVKLVTTNKKGGKVKINLVVVGNAADVIKTNISNIDNLVTISFVALDNNFDDN